MPGAINFIVVYTLVVFVVLSEVCYVCMPTFIANMGRL